MSVDDCMVILIFCSCLFLTQAHKEGASFTAPAHLSIIHSNHNGNDDKDMRHTDLCKLKILSHFYSEFQRPVKVVLVGT
jgi:hypothetical protein